MADNNNSKRQKPQRDRTLGAEERLQRRANLNLSIPLNESKASLGSKRQPFKITVPQKKVTATNQRQREESNRVGENSKQKESKSKTRSGLQAPSENLRSSRQQQENERLFTDEFQRQSRKSKVLREDSVSSNSVLDRIDTKKINVSDILGEDFDAPLGKNNNYDPYRVFKASQVGSKSSKSSKKRRQVVNDELPEYSDESQFQQQNEAEARKPTAAATKFNSRNPSGSRNSSKATKKKAPPSRQNQSKNQQQKHAPLTTARGPSTDDKLRNKSKSKSKKQNPTEGDKSSEDEESSSGDEETKQVQANGNQQSKPKAKQGYVDITEEELNDILAMEKQFELMTTLSGLDVNQTIFRAAPLKRFFTKTMAEMNPTLSVQATTLDFYERVFSNFILPRVCFAYWDIQNDLQSYEYWPEALKMDKFLETAWKENYEDDLRHRFIYNP